MYHLLWYFFLYAFLGWCLEVTYAAYLHKKFVNRGFLSGPVCPIYGIGVCIVYTVLMPVSGQPLLLFAGAVLLTTVLEGATGVALEKLFHQKWWDYSDKKYHWKGFICLEMSFVWGLACVVIIKMVFPATDYLIGLLPHLLGIFLLSLAGILLVADVITTVLVIAGMQKQMKLLFELSEKIREESERFGKQLSKNTLELIRRYEAIARSSHVLMRRMMQAYPKMQSNYYSEQLYELRRRMTEREIVLKLKKKRKKQEKMTKKNDNDKDVCA